MDTHDPGNYLLTVKGRRVQDGQILFTTDLRLPVQTWVGADLDRLAHIGDDSAEVELWLQKGAPVQELPVEVDLVDARTGQTRSSLSHRRLTRDKTRVPFDLQGLAPATYHVRVRPRIDGRLWDDGVRRSLYLYRNGPPPEPEPPIEIPVAPQLFVDDFLIEDQIHLQRVFHPARKLTAHFTPEIGSEIDLKRYYHEPQTLMGGALLSDPWKAMMVKTDGSVIPSHGRCYNFPVGRIAEKDLPTIWNSERFLEFRRLLKANGGSLPACARCCGLTSRSASESEKRDALSL